MDDTITLGPDSIGTSYGRANWRPKMRIAHLMLWTLCSAVFLAVMCMEMEYHRRDPSVEISTTQRVTNVLQGVIAGAVVMGVAVLFFDRFRRNVAMLQLPGHWLLMGAAVTYLAGMPLIMMATLLDKTQLVDNRIFMAFGMDYAASAAVYFAALAKHRSSGWRTFFAAFACEHFVQSAIFIGLWSGRFGYNSFAVVSGLAGFANLALATWLAVFTIIDLSVGRRLDWLHWMGVITCGASRLTFLVWWSGVWLVA